MVKCECCGKVDSCISAAKEYVVRFRGRKFRKLVKGYRCMECGEVFIDPSEDQRLEKDYQDFVARVLKETKNYTCVGCDQNETCACRWDEYNTNGDCLASK